jgi:Flp pilus assembly protein TadD
VPPFVRGPYDGGVRPLVAALVVALAGCATPARQVPDEAYLDPAGVEAYREAVVALDAGEPETALAEIGPAVAHEPWHVPSHALRQDALVALGRQAEAAAWYSDELARRAGDPARTLLVARAGTRSGGLREAGYREALRLDPGSVWPRIALGYELARVARDETVRATALADAGLTVESDAAARRAEAAEDEAESFASAAAAERPDLAAAEGCLSDVLLTSRESVRGSRAADALRAAEAAARLDDASPRAWNRVGLARRAVSDDEGAAAAFARAAKFAPKDASIRANLGRVLLDLRRDAEASEVLGETSELDPSDSSVALNHGVALFRTRDLEGARKEFARAARIAESDPAPHEALALTLAELGDREGAALAMERYLAKGGADRDAARSFVAEMRAAPTP